MQFNLVLIFFFFHEFLILLSQFGDASKYHYVESVLNSLQRIEDLVTKQAEQQTLNCLVPLDKLVNLFSEVSKAPNNDSDEVHYILKVT